MIYWPFFADCDSICAFARVKVGPCVSRARLPQITWCINSARTCVPTRSMITALKEHTEVAQCVGLFAMHLYLGCSRKPKKIKVARSQASTSEHSSTTPPARGEIVRVLRNILATHEHYPEDLILQAHPASRRCTCNTFKALATHIGRSDEQRLHVVAKAVPSMRTFMHPFSLLVERGRVDLKNKIKIKKKKKKKKKIKKHTHTPFEG